MNKSKPSDSLKVVSVTPLEENPDFKVPKGKAWVGDPCYILGMEPFWQELCEKTFERRGSRYEFKYSDGYVVKLMVDGKPHEVMFCGTAFGDGSYPVFVDGIEMGTAGVDSGTLSIIPLDLAKTLQEIYVKGNSFDAGVKVSIAKSEMPWADNGNFGTSNLEVITEGEDDEDEDVSEDDYDDEDDDEEAESDFDDDE